MNIVVARGLNFERQEYRNPGNEECNRDGRRNQHPEANLVELAQAIQEYCSKEDARSANHRNNIAANSFCADLVRIRTEDFASRQHAPNKKAQIDETQHNLVTAEVVRHRTPGDELVQALNDEQTSDSLLFLFAIVGVNATNNRHF